MDESDDLWLGIDLGTQGVRVMVVDGRGEVVGAGEAPLTGASNRHSGNRHEQDPQAWWAGLCAAARRALAAARGRRVAALAIDSTSGTILVQDQHGRPRGAALMYDDGRAANEAATAQRVGASHWAELGYRMQPSWALPKLMWLGARGAFDRGDTVAHQADHIAARLIGRPVATDTSHALKTGADPRTASWPVALLEALGADPTWLPDLVLPGAELGHVSPAAAEATGIPAGVAVRAGMTDGCAAQIASAALTPGSASSALGTTLVIKTCSETLLADPAGAVYSHRSPDGLWLPGGASNTGAGVIARDFPGADLDALTRAATDYEPAPGVTYPLAGVGERFPFIAPDARGFCTVAHRNPAVRFAGVLQGIAFVERLCYESLADLGARVDGPVTFTGGAARNDYWNQLRANILGRPARVPEVADAAVGMAILAASAPGALAATAQRMVRFTRSFHPDPDRGARLAERYSEFIRALTARGWLAGAR